MLIEHDDVRKILHVMIMFENTNTSAVNNVTLCTIVGSSLILS